MRIHIQPAIEVDDQKRIHRLVAGAVFGLLDGIAQVDPDAVGHAVVVVVDIPRADGLPVGNRDVAVQRNDSLRELLGTDIGLPPSKCG